MKLEEQLDRLAACGISSTARARDALLESFDRDDYEARPFDLVLAGLGSEDESPPHKPLSPDIWYFDTECIEGPGSYVRILQRLEGMSAGEMQLSDLRDSIDFSARVAIVELTAGGKPHKIKLKVDDDWVDSRIFALFDRLLASAGSARRLVAHHEAGQALLVGCATPAQLRGLKALGVPLKWMNPRPMASWLNFLRLK